MYIENLLLAVSIDAQDDAFAEEQALPRSFWTTHSVLYKVTGLSRNQKQFIFFLQQVK